MMKLEAHPPDRKRETNAASSNNRKTSAVISDSAVCKEVVALSGWSSILNLPLPNSGIYSGEY